MGVVGESLEGEGGAAKSLEEGEALEGGEERGVGEDFVPTSPKPCLITVLMRSTYNSAIFHLLSNLTNFSQYLASQGLLK